jgi:hypothetical protein
MHVLLTSICWCSRYWCHQLWWWMLIPGEVCGHKPWLPRYACNCEHIYVCNLSPSKCVCVCVCEREREREGCFFVYLLMWMCLQRWWIWLQGSLDRRIVLSKSFFILLYACLLFFKTCNSAASLSFSNFCVLVAVQFFLTDAIAKGYTPCTHWEGFQPKPGCRLHLQVSNLTDAKVAEVVEWHFQRHCGD